MSERAFEGSVATPRPTGAHAVGLRRAGVASVGPVAAALALVTVLSTGASGVAVVAAAGLAVVGAVAWIIRLLVQGGAGIAAAICLGLAGAEDVVGSSPLDRALGAAALQLVAPLLAIVIARSRLAWVALGAGLAAGPVRALVYDPFLDPSCAMDCAASPLAIGYHGTLAAVLLGLGTGVAAGAVTLLALRSARHWQLAVVAAAAWAVALDRATALVVVAAAVALLSLALDVVQLTTARRRLDRLARALRTTSDVQATLRRNLGDDTLTVAYMLDDGGMLVARDGSRVDPPPGGNSSDVHVGGEPVARIFHAAGGVEVGALAAAVDGSARIALENERLAAQVSVRLDELRESRARIVRRADEERRRIERDVHDGAQQHVLALGLELRTALGRLAPDDPARSVLERCLEETGAVLDDLRELSHGIYPASLEAGGLAHGLRTLAGRARVPLLVAEVPPARYDDEIERAAFAFVADAEEHAAIPLHVAAREEDGVLVASVKGSTTLSDHVVDRIGAAGGRVEIHGDTIVASLPCAPSSPKISS